MDTSIMLHLLWFSSAILVYAEYCYLWQLKWYRFDRFRDFLSTKQGRAVLKNPYVLCRTAIILVLLLFRSELNIIHSIAGIIFFADIVYIVYRKFQGVYRRPVLSIKAVGIVVIAIFIEYLSFLFTQEWTVVLTLSVLRLYIMSLIVIGMDMITGQIKKIYFFFAKKKLAQYPHMIKIGITGSYGKTSVKELLTQILSHSFQVVSTPKNVNSDIGIAQFILSTDFSKIEICIVEMGAYNVGDIALSCDIVKPQISILTAINAQHLSLFGSIENTQRAKFEILQAIPKTGLGITNADSPLCMEHVHTLDSNIATFGFEEDNKPNCLIQSVEIKKDKTFDATYSLDFQDKKETFTVNTSLVGEHQASNLAPCILVATHLGMKTSEIINAIARIKNPTHAFNIFQYGQATIIDDSYNSNPDGFKSALNILAKFSSAKKKIVITRGMHELGSMSDDLHERIGNEISFVADELVLITPDFVNPICKGILEKYHTKIYKIFDTNDLIHHITKFKDLDVVILIENRVPPAVHQLLHNK